jgi:hypothetical protein
MGEKASRAIEIVTAASLLGSSIAGCSPTPNRQPTYENTPIPKESSAAEVIDSNIEDMYYHTERIDNQSSQKVEESSDIPEIFAEQKVFDFEILNIADWSNFELEKIEEKEPGYGVDVTKETSMFMIPLKSDNFFDDKKEVKEILAPSGSTFEIAEVRTLIGPNKEMIKVGHVANTYGSHVLSTLVLEAQDSNGIKQIFTEEKEKNERTVSYVVTEDNIYPNKVKNTLIALKNISLFQDENGMFKKGEVYSYLDMIGLKDPSKNHEYGFGLTSSKSIVKGGGVCAMATGTSALVHLQGEDDYKILEQWAHPIRYAQGPFSPSEYLVDATVDHNSNETFDFRWEQGEDKYMHANIFISPSDVPFEQTNQDGVGGVSDVIMVVSLSFEDEAQEKQTEYISEILDQYEQYRDSNHTTKLNPSQMEVNILNHPISSDIFDSVKLIYDVEDIREFESVIAEKQEFQDILKLQEAVNSYDEESGISLDIYLKGTEWYKTFKDEEARKEADRRISHATTSRIKGQPLQCVGFVMLVSSLYPELSIPYVGSVQASTAREFVPPDLRNYKYSEAKRWYTNFGAVAYGGPLTIDMYEPGDLFVRTDGAKAASTQKPTGHIGLIMDKIVKENGEVILLVADSNRHNDGRIRIFTVDQNNMEEILGFEQRYLLRNPN